MRNPFRQTLGSLNENFVGRDYEINAIKKLIQGLSRDNLDPKALICYGPQGYGKTTLLGYVAKHSDRFCKELVLDSPIKTVRATPDVCDIASLYEIITGESALVEEITQDKTDAGVNVGIAKFGSEGALTRVYDSSVKNYLELFKTVSAKNPILLCIDEAHTMSSDQMRRMLLSIQGCTERDIPVSVVLAGTPKLQPLIRSCGATFAERYKRMTIGPLDNRYARALLVEPFEKQGMNLPEARVKEALDNCHNYPFFLQAYGHSIWEHCIEQGTLIERDSMWQRAKDEFNETKNRMYGERYGEFRKEQVLYSAYVIAEIFKINEVPSHVYLADYLREKGVPDPDEAIEKLDELGYIWNPEKPWAYEQGIPSLMDFVGNTFEQELSQSQPRSKD